MARKLGILLIETKIYQSRRLRYGSLGAGKSCALSSMISNMAEPIWVYLIVYYRMTSFFAPWRATSPPSSPMTASSSVRQSMHRTRFSRSACAEHCSSAARRNSLRSLIRRTFTSTPQGWEGNNLGTMKCNCRVPTCKAQPQPHN